MKLIIFGGTTEGRELSERMAAAGAQFASPRNTAAKHSRRENISRYASGR